MALQPMNFANIPVQNPDYSNLANLFQNYYKGYEAGRTPERIRQEELKRELESKLLGEQAKYYGPKAQAEIQNLNAQSQHYASGGMGKYTGLAADWNNLRRMEQELGADHPYVQGFKKDLENRQNVQQSLYQTRNQQNMWRPWTMIDTNDQVNIISQYRSLGYDPQTALSLWNQQITPEKIAENIAGRPRDPAFNPFSLGENQQEPSNAPPPQQGQIPSINPFEPQIVPDAYGMVSNEQLPSHSRLNIPIPPPNAQQVLPTHAPTTANITDIVQTQGNKAEAKFLGTLATEWNAPYVQLGGLKSAWTSLAKRNDPEALEERAKYLAAQMMGPEASLLNIKLAAGSNANEAIKDVEKRLKLDAKKEGVTITEQDYRRATRLMHEALDKGAEIRINAMKGASNGMSAEQFNQQVSNKPKKALKSYTDADINATAKKYNLTPAQVRKQLEEQNK